MIDGTTTTLEVNGAITIRKRPQGISTTSASASQGPSAGLADTAGAAGSGVNLDVPVGVPTYVTTPEQAQDDTFLGRRRLAQLSGASGAPHGSLKRALSNQAA